MSCCCLPPDRVKLIVNGRAKMGLCYLAPDRVKLTVNSKKETNSRVKMGKESKWAKGQNGLLLFTPWKSQNGLLLFTPWQSQTNSEQQERNKQQGQNGQRVKMGQGSRWASVLYPLTESNWQWTARKKQTVGLKWAKSQNGPRAKISFCYLPPEKVKMGQRSLWAAVVCPLTESN